MAYLQKKDYETLDKMEKYGGSFVKTLAKLVAHADSENLAKIKTTWPEYWDKYEKM